MDVRFADPIALESDDGPEAPFEMTNLYPRTTGLPMTIWISPRGRARHDARIKVCRRHGDRMDPDDTASVAIRPVPRLARGDLNADDLVVVSAWIELNAEVLIDIWNGDGDPVSEAQRFRRL